MEVDSSTTSQPDTANQASAAQGEGGAAADKPKKQAKRKVAMHMAYLGAGFSVSSVTLSAR